MPDAALRGDFLYILKCEGASRLFQHHEGSDYSKNFREVSLTALPCSISILIIVLGPKPRLNHVHGVVQAGAVPPVHHHQGRGQGQDEDSGYRADNNDSAVLGSGLRVGGCCLWAIILCI